MLVLLAGLISNEIVTNHCAGSVPSSGRPSVIGGGHHGEAVFRVEFARNGAGFVTRILLICAQICGADMKRINVKHCRHPGNLAIFRD